MKSLRRLRNLIEDLGRSLYSYLEDFTRKMNDFLSQQSFFLFKG